ncbi:Ribonuclease H-like superfamily [Sesbania bispinosa]|nr:Ribonuclease H-like superfamily [Sesbania bispinosa]
MASDRPPPSTILGRIRSLSADIQQFLIGMDMQRIVPPRLVSWKAPADGVAVNCDGSSIGNPGRAGFGGLICDPLGTWQCGFYGSIGQAECLQAELMGLLIGLQVSWERGFRKVDCFYDSNNALHLISIDSIQFHQHATIIMHIRDLIQRDWDGGITGFSVSRIFHVPKINSFLTIIYLMNAKHPQMDGIMSFARNFQAEDRSLHGGYWSTCDGNNFDNASRKRNRNNYYQRNYNFYNNNQTKFGDHSGNFNFYNVDQANYVKYDVIPSSSKRRKYSAPAWEESQKYYIPSAVHDNIPSSYSFQAYSTRSNADTSTSASCKPDCSIFEDDEPVFMSRDDIDRNSPSRKDGIDVRHETHLRYSYCAFLQNLGMRLELPQTTIGTAMLIATATLFLAAKSEESPRPLNNVLRASSEILHKQDFALLSYWFPVDWFEQYRERVLEAEQLILTTLNFELNVQHPYGPLTSVLNKLVVMFVNAIHFEFEDKTSLAQIKLSDCNEKPSLGNRTGGIGC